MKPTAGSVRPRHVTPPPRKTRLNLQRRPKPEPPDDLEARQQSSFWKWFLVVAALHVLIILAACIYYASIPAAKPTEELMSLLPPGDLVKGTAGQQKAHKLGPTTAASIAHHAAAPMPTGPVTPPQQVKPLPTPPVLPQPAPPIPILKADSLAAKADKPPVKPQPPKPPKVKVDLHLADGPATDTPKPVKPHPKKPVKNPDDSDQSDDNDSTAKKTTTGLSKEQIAAKLGDKSDAAGVKNATKLGASGSAHSQANDFQGFYAAIRDQVMSQWESPNLTDTTAVNPIVHIHVEKNGRVPPESVYLQRSSGNPTYDDSAVTAAKSLGYLHEPLPDGCPPDIPITFKLTR